MTHFTPPGPGLPYTYNPPTLDFFFVDFHWDMSEDWINIYNIMLSYYRPSSEKLLKIFYKLLI